MDAVIEINDLGYRFGKKVALDGVSLSIPAGQVFGLVGENGAGKTTLIKHILGALSPQQGTVRVFGEDPTRNPAKSLARIGYLSEDRDLPMWMRVRELIRYTRAFYSDWDAGYAEELRDRFRLASDTRVRSLSRGEKARMGLLLALSHRPDLLLLDEPSSGLDAVSRHDILSVIVKSVAEEGRTVVFSSHLLEEVERVVDHIAMFRNGKLDLVMPVDELRATHHRLVIAFDDPVARFPELDIAVHVQGEGREWSAVVNGDRERVEAAIAHIGARIVDHATPSLDEVFVARVAGGRDTGDQEVR